MFHGFQDDVITDNTLLKLYGVIKYFQRKFIIINETITVFAKYEIQKRIRYNGLFSVHFETCLNYNPTSIINTIVS